MEWMHHAAVIASKRGCEGPPDPNDPFEGPAIIDLVRRFGDRIEFTTNLMPGAAGPD